jgi:hypothetical protein
MTDEQMTSVLYVFMTRLTVRDAEMIHHRIADILGPGMNRDMVSHLRSVSQLNLALREIVSGLPEHDKQLIAATIKRAGQGVSVDDRALTE